MKDNYGLEDNIKTEDEVLVEELIKQIEINYNNLGVLSEALILLNRFVGDKTIDREKLIKLSSELFLSTVNKIGLLNDKGARC
jgi:hypothetical protein